MKNILHEVKFVEDNYTFDSKRILNALILREANPINSIVFIGDEDKEIDILCKKSGIERKENGFYKNEILLDRDVQISTLIDSLVTSAEIFVARENDATYQCNMVRNIIKNYEIKKQVENEKDVLTVDDLMKSLYGIEEEKEGKKVC